MSFIIDNTWVWIDKPPKEIIDIAMISFIMDETFNVGKILRHWVISNNPLNITSIILFKDNILLDDETVKTIIEEEKELENKGEFREERMFERDMDDFDY